MLQRSWALLGLALCSCVAVQSGTPSAVTLPAVFGASDAAPRAAERVVLVTVAGLTPQAYLGPGTLGTGDLGAGTGGAIMPTLAALAAAGVAAERVESVVPSTPYPVHTTLVTGRRPAEHGVVADRRLGERGVRRAFASHASAVQGPTLWQVAASEQVTVAALDWPVTVGAAIPLLLPDVRPTRSGETWLGVVRDSTTPWLRGLAEAGSPDARSGRPGPAFDALLVDMACATLVSETPPVLLLLRLGQTGAALAAAGPHDDTTRAAFARVDAELGRLLGCLDTAGRLAETAFVVAGDRALLPVHSVIHPNAALAEGGLVGGGRRRWIAVARSNGGSAFVYARDAEAAVVARDALDAMAQRTRAFRIVSADEMIRLGADPEAWFGLEAQPGFVFSDGIREPRVQAAPLRGAGGYLATAASPGFVAAGAGVRRGLRIPQMRQTDIAPTLAVLLGLDLGATDGRAVLGALESRSPARAERSQRTESSERAEPTQAPGRASRPQRTAPGPRSRRSAGPEPSP